MNVLDNKKNQSNKTDFACAKKFNINKIWFIINFDNFITIDELYTKLFSKSYIIL